MPRVLLSVAIAALLVSCGDGESVATRYANACIGFCHNRYDCLGDPEGRRPSCRPACEGAMPPPGACEAAATTWVRCLEALSCTQLAEVGAPERYCGAEHRARDEACALSSDGGM